MENNNEKIKKNILNEDINEKNEQEETSDNLSSMDMPTERITIEINMPFEESGLYSYISRVTKLLKFFTAESYEERHEAIKGDKIMEEFNEKISKAKDY